MVKFEGISRYNHLIYTGGGRGRGRATMVMFMVSLGKKMRE